MHMEIIHFLNLNLRLIVRLSMKSGVLQMTEYEALYWKIGDKVTQQPRE